MSGHAKPVERRPEPSSMPGEALAARDIASEEALLGAILIRPELVATVDLDPDHFYRTGHQRLFEAMQWLASEDRLIDPVTCRDAMARRGWLEDINGLAGIAALIDKCPSASHAEAYAKLVREKADLRTLTEQVTSLKARLEVEADSPEALLAEAEATVAALQSQAQRFQASDAMAQLEAWYESVNQLDAGPRIGLGLPAIDHVLEGVQPGEVLGIMARPGIGKTVLLCHITSHMAGLGHACFSLEMPKAQIVERLARMAYGVHKRELRAKVRGGLLDPATYLEVYQHLELDDTPKLSVSQMAARVRRMQARRAVTVVSIDHLGLIGGDDRLDGYERVSKQARELKEMAKRARVAVVLLIQVNRESGGDGSRELHLGSARDSGVIEEACDYLLTLRRLDRSTTLSEVEREKYKDILFAKVLKHRHGVPMVKEVGYRIDFASLRLIEEPAITPNEDDLKKLSRVGGRR